MTSRKLTFTETTQLHYANTLHWLSDDTANTTTNTTLTYPAFTRHDSTLTTDSTFYVMPSLSMDAFAARTIWGVPATPTEQDNQRLYGEYQSMVYNGAVYTLGERLSLPVPTMYL